MKQRFFWLAIMCVPVWVHAEFWITEIHYNPAGSDSGYEWVELWNPDPGSASLEGYKLRENGTNHGLQEYQDDLILSGGQYAVIADKPEKFLSYFSDYAGTIIDSAFSLSNTGELLELINSDGATVFSVEYSSDTGGSDNGNSIGLVGDIWYEVTASPGQENSIVINSSTSEDETDADPGDTPTVAEDTTPITYVEIKNPDYTQKVIKVDAGGDRTVMAGVGYWFSGTVYGLQGGLIEHPEVSWNWGDGSMGQGQTDIHRYRYPGVYTIAMSAQVLGYSAHDRATITVIPPALTLSVVTDHDDVVIAITNTSPYSLEISGYRLDDGRHDFIFPEHSFVNSGQTLLLDPVKTGLTVESTTILEFLDGEDFQIGRISVAEYLLQQQITNAQFNNLDDTLTAGMVDVQSPRGTHSVAYHTITPKQVKTDDPPRPLTDDSDTFVSMQQAQTLSGLDHAQPTDTWWHIIALCVIVLFAGGLYIYQTRRERAVDEQLGNKIDIID